MLKYPSQRKFNNQVANILQNGAKFCNTKAGFKNYRNLNNF